MRHILFFLLFYGIRALSFEGTSQDEKGKVQEILANYYLRLSATPDPVQKTVAKLQLMTIMHREPEKLLWWQHWITQSVCFRRRAERNKYLIDYCLIPQTLVLNDLTFILKLDTNGNIYYLLNRKLAREDLKVMSNSPIERNRELSVVRVMRYCTYLSELKNPIVNEVRLPYLDEAKTLLDDSTLGISTGLVCTERGEYDRLEVGSSGKLVLHHATEYVLVQKGTEIVDRDFRIIVVPAL
jgi:hypothetical protein